MRPPEPPPVNYKELIHDIGLSVGLPAAGALTVAAAFPHTRSALRGAWKETSDPRLYSNIRGAFTGEDAKERTLQHRHLAKGDHSILGAMHEGFFRPNAKTASLRLPMKITDGFSYVAGQRHALFQLKLANMRGMVAPALAGAAIGGVGGAAMAPEGEGLKGALIGGGIGAAGGAGGAALGHAAGSKAVNRAQAAGEKMITQHAKGQGLDVARGNRLQELASKALESQNSLRNMGGAAGAGAAGYLGSQVASKLQPQSQPGLFPMEDDPYYMSQYDMQQMPPSR